MFATLAALPIMAAAAPAPEAPAWIASGKILGTLLFAVVLIIVVVAMGMIARSKSGKMREAGASAGVILIGILLIVLALGGGIWIIGQGIMGITINSV